MTEPILTVRNVVKTFGGIRAVDGCSLAVRPATITGLIGPNGAGKSTLFNVISGLYAPDEGEVWFAGRRLDGSPAHAVVRQGLVKTFQIPREFREMTVLENLLVVGPRRPGERIVDVALGPYDGRQDETWIRKSERVLTDVGLRSLRDEYAKNLSGGQKKLLELARSLMADPRMVLLDEPVAGVNPTLAQHLLGLIENLRAKGLTFFLIEHDMDVVMKRCEWIIVMHQGRTLTEGVAEEIKVDRNVIDAYLGG